MATTILIVDDDANLRRVLSFFLQGTGQEILQARTGQEGLDMARAHVPDLIILDVMMPAVSGFDVCRELKSDARTSYIPILLCTARSKMQDVMEAAKVGADGYIVKPFTKDSVLERIRMTLARKLTPVPAAAGAKDERRQFARMPVRWQVSWAPNRELGTDIMYRNVVVNVSPKGFAFEYSRCTVCTGYRATSVHPMCLLAPVSRPIVPGKMMGFALSLASRDVIQVEASIVHIWQPQDAPDREVVGAAFTAVAPEAVQAIVASLKG